MKKEITRDDLKKLNEFCYEISKSFRPDMRVPAQVYMNEQMMDVILGDRSLEQLVNTSTLPGIQKFALAMPDIHQGYGFPIGGVVATAIDEGGVISPGGIGYDINCGVRLLATNMKEQEARPYMEKLATAVFHAVPSGVGKGGKWNLTVDELDKVLRDGAAYMVKPGYGTENDLEHCEERGCMRNAEPSMISDRAKRRGLDQLGTLGSGNHFLEFQKVETIYDEKSAQAFGLTKDLVVVMIHCGSRGLGHQTCTDYVRRFMKSLNDFGIVLPDRELVCAPVTSQEGTDYYNAMAAAANFAWANRHMIGHAVRESFRTVVGKQAAVTTVYDVSHNMGKKEKHWVGDIEKELLVHRKGSTRAFGPKWPNLPSKYKKVGQPVLIPGTMGTSSYVLVGVDDNMDKTWGTVCHGAGRRMSRTQAKKMVTGSQLRERLENQGIIIRCDSDAGLSEEAPLAYKDVDNVVNVVDGAGLAKKVARVIPLAVIKGG